MSATRLIALAHLSTKVLAYINKEGYHKTEDEREKPIDNIQK